MEAVAIEEELLDMLQAQSRRRREDKGASSNSDSDSEIARGVADGARDDTLELGDGPGMVESDERVVWSVSSWYVSALTNMLIPVFGTFDVLTVLL